MAPSPSGLPQSRASAVPSQAMPAGSSGPVPAGFPEAPPVGSSQASPRDLPGDPQRGASPSAVPQPVANSNATGGRTDSDARTTPVFLLPTTIVASGVEKPPSRPRESDEDAALSHARALDQILSDGVQDLQLRLDVSETLERAGRQRSELELVELAAKRHEWTVSPSLEPQGSRLMLRIVAVAPGSDVALVRAERLKPSEIAVRAVVMLRDLLVGRSQGTPAAGAAPSLEPAADNKPRLAAPVRSEGRAALALNGALLGAFLGYSLQRSSDDADSRILYPLMALGTGFGLAASAVVAEEWDIGVGDAWYLSAGAWWPALSGFLLAGSRSNSRPSEQYTGALVGAGVGIAAATTSLALHHGISEGGALVAHSGGAFGMFLGGLAEYTIRGSTENDPARGLGYGAAAGAVAGGALAMLVRPTPSQVFLVDLGAGLGGLAAAAVTSPFVFRSGEATDERIFLISTMSATVAGGVVGYLFTRRSSASRASAPPFLPYGGVVGTTRARDGSPQSCFGFGFQGTF